MSKGSKNSASKTVATIGYISTLPVKTTVTFKGRDQTLQTTKPRSVTITKGPKNSTSTSKTVATIGYISAPAKTTVTFKGGKGVGSYETKSGVSYGDKQSGCYGRSTTKEKASAGKFQWKNGTSGTMIEYKKSSTVRVGNKSGYTEVYNEQRVRNVTYNKTSGSKNLITYNNG